MKITYKPLPENGDRIVKYGVSFERDETVEVSDEKLAKRLLTNAYFVEEVDKESVKVDKEVDNVDTEEAEVTRRKRRTKAEMEALRNGENQSTSGTPGTPDDAGG